MGDVIEGWTGYRPGDFLLFSERTYWRLFELHNEALWPLPLVVPPLLGLALLALAGRRRRAGLAAGLLLAACWAGVAALFLEARYLPVNWAVAHVLPLFWFEAVLLALIAPTLRPPSADAPAAARLAGGALALAALGWPLLAPLSGRPLAQAEIAGLAPDPTALATLAFLALCRPGWRRPVLALVPLAWLCASAATLVTMGTPGAGAPLVAALASIAALVATGRGARGPAAAPG